MACQNPIKLEKDGEILYYSCGKCSSCVNSKSHLLEQCTRVESSAHKYTLFGTLTYSTKHLPIVEVVPHFDSGYVEFRSITPRVIDYLGDDLLSEAYFRKDMKKYLLPVTLHKSKLPYQNCVGHLFYRDVQLFMKRLRRRIQYAYVKQYCVINNIINFKSLCDEEKKRILQTVPRYRFLCVGEYGPATFRPHYHLLFFADSSWLCSTIRRLFGEVWQYGRTDIQLSSGYADSYVSSYLSSSCTLPPLIVDLNQRTYVHSSAYGWIKKQEVVKDIREVTYEKIASRSLIYAGKSHILRIPGTLEANLFPKSYRFSDSTDFANLRRYTCYRYFAKEWKLEKVVDIVQKYFEWFDLDNQDFGLNCHDMPAFDWLSPDFLLALKCDDFLDAYDSHQPHLLKDRDCIVSRLYAILYTSRKFLRNCEEYGIGEHEYYQLIKKYYQDKDFHLLTGNFVEMSRLGSPELMSYYYGNIERDKPFDLLPPYMQSRIKYFADGDFCNLDKIAYYFEHPEENPIQREKVFVSDEVIANKVKHKDQNDRNKMFLYD